MKKILLLLLITILLQCRIFAYTDISDKEFEKKAQLLSEYNIINGYGDGTFRPQNPITRAEFCKMIMCTTMNDGIETVQEGFSDVSDGFWAKEYIYAAKALEIVNGVTATTFAPQANITNEQAVKMIVCSLGYGEEAIAAGGYPVGYIKIAKDLGIISNNINAKAVSTRQEIAGMVYNAIDVRFYFLSQNEDGSIERAESESTLKEYHGFLTDVTSGVDTDEESEVIMDETEEITDESKSITEESSNDDEVILSESELETVG